MSSKKRLFLLEFFISKIKIGSSVPQFRSIAVHLFSDKILDLKITAEEFEADKDVQAVDGEFKADMGKTFLFQSKPEDLVRQLEQKSLEINLLVSGKIIGSSSFPWKKEFTDMIQTFESVGIVKSVNYEGKFDLTNSSRQVVGYIVLAVKMSCLGETAETYLNLQGREALFINPKTFQHIKCDKYEFTNDKIHPVSALYNPIVAERTTSTTKYSWNQIFGTKAADAKSIAPMGMDTEAGGVGKSISRTRQIMSRESLAVSMKYRPPEYKFMDVMNLMSADVETRNEETIVNLAIEKRRSNAVNPEHSKKKKILGPLDASDQLTEEELNEKLCRNCDCEALKKFHEHGIGPRYRPSGLGEFYEICEPSTTYGMYHVFENLSRYGPQSFYRSPKDPYQKYTPAASKFHGPERIKYNELCYCQPFPDKALAGDELCCCCRIHQQQQARLRGGGETKRKIKLCKMCRHAAENIAGRADQSTFPLRLRGGGIIEKNEETLSRKPWDPIITEIVKKIIEQVSI